jgi:hypothetical protein
VRPAGSRGAAGVVASAVAAILLLAGCGRTGAPEAPAPPPEPVRIAVLSDLNSAYGSTRYGPQVAAVVAHVATVWRPELVLIAGDMIAGQRPSLTDENVRAMWAAFDDVVARPFREAGIPLAFTLGNHDGSAHPGHERDRALAAEYWRQPEHVPAVELVDAGHYPFRYAFRLRHLHVTVLDATAAALVADTAQLAWIRHTLEAPPARRAGSRIAIGHLPLYAVAEGRNRRGEVLDRPDEVRGLLERRRVDLYISGHHHAYFPGRRGRLDLLYAGALGDGPRMLIGGARPAERTVTLLEVHDGRGSDGVVFHSYRVGEPGGPGPLLEPLDPAELPERLTGINGWVERR